MDVEIQGGIKKMKINLHEHLAPEIIEEIINVSIQYIFGIIVYLVVLLTILVGLKLLFNINLFKTIKKVMN